MAVVGSLVVLLAANNTALTAGLLKAEGQLKTFGATAGTTGAMTGAILGGIGLVAAAGMGLAVMAAKSFQEQMAKVNTIAHLTPPELATLGQEVRNLSVATGVGVGDLTSGLYDLFSVGVPAANVMELLTNATTLSIGGLSTANEAVLAITTAINAWSGATGEANLTMADSAKVTDIFAQAIAAGGMTAADIPGALANVAAQAAMMNMPLEEIGAAWSILTVRGLSAAEASTSVAAALSALAKAPPGMEKLEKATGKTYLQIAKTQGVHEALMQLVADAEGLGVPLQDVFGRKEALPFASFTTGATGDQLWTQALADEFNSGGVAAGQMEERVGTLDNQLRILNTSLNELGISLGTGLLPPLTSFVESLSGAVQGVTAWVTANPQLASTILPVVTGVGLLAAGVLVANLAIGAMGLLLSPVVLTFAAISAAVILVVNNMDALKAGIQLVSDALAKFNAEHGGTPLPALAGLGDEGIGRRTPQPPPPSGVDIGHGVNLLLGGGGALIGGLGDQIFRGGQPERPIQINSTTNVTLDGEKVGSVTDRRLYNNASQASSGFNRGALE